MVHRGLECPVCPWDLNRLGVSCRASARRSRAPLPFDRRRIVPSAAWNEAASRHGRLCQRCAEHGTFEGPHGIEKGVGLQLQFLDGALVAACSAGGTTTPARRLCPRQSTHRRTSERGGSIHSTRGVTAGGKRSLGEGSQRGGKCRLRVERRHDQLHLCGSHFAIPVLPGDLAVEVCSMTTASCIVAVHRATGEDLRDRFDRRISGSPGGCLMAEKVVHSSR